MTCIYVVDDEPDFTWALKSSLSFEGYDVVAVHSGAEALESMQTRVPDLLILDIIMPGMDGLEVCRRIRLDPKLAGVPILFLTAKGSSDDRLKGFAEGGDDYVIKPFELLELKARILALLHRCRPEAPVYHHRRMQAGKLVLDLETYQAQVEGRSALLTETEFKLLHFLMTHPKQIFTNAELLQAVWGCPKDLSSSSLVRWHMHNLRAKIEFSPGQPAYIQTVANRGYAFVGEPEPSNAQPA